MTLSPPARNHATLVPEDRRMAFLPRLFGHRHPIIGEYTVFGVMDRLSPGDYCRGMWDFCELDGAPLYMAPTAKPRFRLACEGNGHQGEVLAGAAGIIVVIKDSDRAFALADPVSFPVSVQSEFGRRRLALARLRSAFRLASDERGYDRLMVLSMLLAATWPGLLCGTGRTSAPPGMRPRSIGRGRPQWAHLGN